MNKEESLLKENATDSPKEPSKEPSAASVPQSSDTQPKRIVDSQIQTIIHRNREPAKTKNAYPTVAQIEDMHFYNINTKMELRCMEHHTRTLIKEAKETQELFETLAKERSGDHQSEESSKSQLLCNTAYEILIKCSTEEVEGLSHFLKQLQSIKGKEEIHLEALENVKISDWDHYLTALQKINQQQTDALNALSFQADSLPLGGAGPLLHRLIRDCYTETREKEQDFSTFRKLPSSLGQTLQHQLEQSF
jgi:hypothetical protein